MATMELVRPLADPAVLAYRDRAAAVLAEAQALAIASPETKATAVDFLGRLARLKREAEEYRITMVKPLNDHVKHVNDTFKGVLGPVDEADRTVRQRMLIFDQEQRRLAAEAAARAERERLESEAMLREAERAEAAGQAAVAESLLTTAVAREETAKVTATQAVAPPKTMAAGAGAATVRKTWTFNVVNLDEVPREWLELNEARVRKAILAGERQIPGLEILQVESLSVRG